MSADAHDRFMAVAVGSDGKAYAAGFVANAGDQALAVARLNDDGELDSTFGTAGVASVNVAAGGKTAEIARSVVVQTDGKIVIAGPVEHDPLAAGDAARDTDIAVVRFDTTGKLDTTFGNEGVARIDISEGKATSETAFTGDTSWGMGLLPGNKLVVFGSALASAERNDADYVLVGLTADGELDAGFGDGGKLMIEDEQAVSDSPRNLLVQSDGKIVATGYSNIAGVVQPVLIRFDATGTLDSAFGDGGIATAKVLAGVTESYSVAQQGSNYVLAGYGRGADSAEKVDMVVYRFTGSGEWDETFGTDGVTRIDIAREDDRARNVMVLPDGRILAVGSGKKDATNVDAMIALFDEDGAPDTTFGTDGQIISDLGGPNDAWYGVALTADKANVLIVGFKGVDPNAGGNDDGVVTRIPLS